LEQIEPTHVRLVGDHASTTGDDMIEAPAPPLIDQRKRRSVPNGARVGPPTVSSSESVQPVEIVVHDQDSTRILLEYAAPVFPAEVVSGSAWTVRLQPPTEGSWIPELLLLILRWLESAHLPCAKVVYGGRSYLVRTSPQIGRASAVTDITSTPRFADGRL
jgi:hypothetical protein